MAKNLETEFKALKAQVEQLVKVHQALGLPTAPWVSPQQAAQLMGTSRSRVQAEIDKAEHARIHGIAYDLTWSTHYRKNGQHWQVNPVEFEAVIFLPPEQRPYIELPS
ncbi:MULTISPECIES: hypothetical protein [Cyanophyceae]|uniref:hypothetical protein n=1 Tax=Cyanophyceae TaxID=3028117 RepID=UPI001682CF82|nr:MULTISPECIES: hypothetical protein [Cyanophyceae]MBD1914602.1 hypothetical protein [Phormidium sp. FACHB-77]MBD2030326.1 hypothetical protein [Phormidium sp. FACHB-322]MBD2049871.1 hypothetical protein [Leptolyngbya sp. FACHB-60]